MDETQFTLDDAHVHFAKALNGETWQLLEKQERSTEERERMLAAAFASSYHWMCAGHEVHRQRSEYLIARVYLALGNVPEALAHARRCMELTDQFRDQMQEFDVAYAYEMLARTNAAAGSLDLARDYRGRAGSMGDLIKNKEDRDIFLGDFNGGDWFGL